MDHCPSEPHGFAAARASYALAIHSHVAVPPNASRLGTTLPREIGPISDELGASVGFPALARRLASKRQVVE
jgi:hypothetical protein